MTTVTKQGRKVKSDMIPSELTPGKIKLTGEGERTIVVFTGNQLRHDRFALRMQHEFGHRVIGWFQVQCEAGKGESGVEEALFADEVKVLRKGAHLKPVVVSDPDAQEVVDQVRELAPFFMVTLGGAIYSEPLLQCVRGVALNQHDGWCPEYKGANTVDWTFYHRDIAHLGNTVHILTSGMDAGPVVRRSSVCLVDNDTRESCFARVVALGTELMCEVVAEALEADEITVYDQPCGSGCTYLNHELTPEVIKAIDRDFQNGWLSFELSRVRRF